MNPDTKKDALNRLSIAQGHLEKVRNMLEADVYCPDVIDQSRSVQAALRKIDEVILHGHLHSCVLHDIHGTKSEKEKLIGEIIEIFRKRD